VLEARRGRLDLTTYHGGYERMPVLAISFLALGLACTGFPGTLGFVGQELLVDGAVDMFPVMGFAIVMASALTGLAVLRMYFSLFCGRSDVLSHSGLQFRLRRREAWTFVALVVILVAFGVAPRPLVDSRFAASDDILRRRQIRMLGGQNIIRNGIRLNSEKMQLPFYENKWLQLQALQEEPLLARWAQAAVHVFPPPRAVTSPHPRVQTQAVISDGVSSLRTPTQSETMSVRQKAWQGSQFPPGAWLEPGLPSAYHHQWLNRGRDQIPQW
jgi:hypothetical protein